MDRREFLKKAAMAGAAGIGAFHALGGMTAAAADGARSELIVAEGGEPAQLLQAALAAYGGLGQVVKPGKTAVLKVNFSWYDPPKRACDTNPDLVAALVRECLKAGAAKVRVIDLAIDNYLMCLESSGIEKAVKAAAKAMGRSKDVVVQDLNLDGPKSPRIVQKSIGVLKDLFVYAEALEADCLINVPILKHHSVTRVTGALKNLMGLVAFRMDMHAAGIDRAIVDLARLIKPHLHIVDAYRILRTNGPQGIGGTVSPARQLILAHDPVAADAYGASLLKLEPTYLRMAADAGLGIADLGKIKLTRVKA